MSVVSEPGGEPVLPVERWFGMFFLALSITWSGLILLIVSWSYLNTQEALLQSVASAASESHDKDFIYRQWATSHGGVYVPLTEQTPPNPNLAHISERDVTTQSGRQLTLVNPAYLTRQVAKMAQARGLLAGKITSLTPLYSGNLPDDWERQALYRLQGGVAEVAEVSDKDGRRQYRLMRPFRIEAACLDCHASQGLQLGDLYGGISVSVDWEQYAMLFSRQVHGVFWGYSGIWAIGMGVLFFGWRRSREYFSTQQLLAERTELVVQLNRANADLHRFAEVAAHHLQEPVRRIGSFTARMRKALVGKSEDPETEIAMRYVSESAERLRLMLRDIQLFLAASEPRGALVEIDTDKLVAKVVQRFTDRLNALNGTVECDNKLPPITLDMGRASDIFTIVIQNALDYARPDVPLVIRIIGTNLEGRVRIAIADNGLGVPEEYRERVFRAFERLHHPGQLGTGVGLAIVRRIVESCEGSVWLEGQDRHGITVVFELPARSGK